MDRLEGEGEGVSKLRYVHVHLQDLVIPLKIMTYLGFFLASPTAFVNRADSCRARHRVVVGEVLRVESVHRVAVLQDVRQQAL